MSSFGYGDADRPTSVNGAAANVTQYACDTENNLNSKTDGKGQTIQYVYDALNRLTQKTDPDATNANYVYDLVRKVQSVNDPTGTYGFAYDNMGRLTGTTTQYAFLPGRTFTNSYSYDVASNSGFGSPVDSTASPHTGPHRLHCAGWEHDRSPRLD